MSEPAPEPPSPPRPERSRPETSLPGVPLRAVPPAEPSSPGIPLSEVPGIPEQGSAPPRMPLSGVPLSGVPLSEVPPAEVPLSEVPLSGVPLSEVPPAGSAQAGPLSGSGPLSGASLAGPTPLSGAPLPGTTPLSGSPLPGCAPLPESTPLSGHPLSESAPLPGSVPAGPPPLRIGHADREEAARLLTEHFSHGRLDGPEFEERVAAAWAARTVVELGAVFSDLPEPQPTILPRTPDPAAPTGLTPTGFAEAGFAPGPGLPGTGFPTTALPGIFPGQSSGGLAGPRMPGHSFPGGLPARNRQQAQGSDVWPSGSAAAYWTGQWSGAAQAYGPPAGLGPSGLPQYYRPTDASGLPVQTWDTDAPFGRDPRTGAPYSDKSKVAAGVLQLFLGFAGVGRFYTGHVGIALAQMLVTILTFGLGAAWGFVDGVLMLAGDPTDAQGRPLRP